MRVPSACARVFATKGGVEEGDGQRADAVEKEHARTRLEVVRGVGGTGPGEDQVRASKDRVKTR